MNRKTIFLFSAIAVLIIYTQSVFAEERKPIKLPIPQPENGKTLAYSLQNRKSVREFTDKELTLQTLSDLLWAACGINRPDTGGRTAPTAKDMQEIDVYVVTAEGAYLYDAKDNALIQVLSGDIRELTGKQPFVKNAPVNLVYVADLSKMRGLPTQDCDFYSATDTGFISENVYLYCAAAGLATVVLAWVDKPALSKAMKLRGDQRIILTQTVGYPKKR